MLMYNSCVTTYVNDFALLLDNNLRGLGLHQMSHFLVEFMNRLNRAQWFPIAFLHLGCFCLVDNYQYSSNFSPLLVVSWTPTCIYFRVPTCIEGAKMHL